MEVTLVHPDNEGQQVIATHPQQVTAFTANGFVEVGQPEPEQAPETEEATDAEQASEAETETPEAPKVEEKPKQVKVEVKSQQPNKKEDK